MPQFIIRGDYVNFRIKASSDKKAYDKYIKRCKEVGAAIDYSAQVIKTVGSPANILEEE